MEPIDPAISSHPIYTPEHILQEKKKFLCPSCFKEFSTKGNMKSHLQTIHLKNLPYKCTVPGCSKKYYNKSKLELHLRSHINVRPYVCPICSKAFKEKNVLKIHVQYHSGLRPFKCQLCPKTYKTKGHLKDHIMTFHEKRKNFFCNICYLTFCRKSALKVHIRSHLDDHSLKLDKKELQGEKENSDIADTGVSLDKKTDKFLVFKTQIYDEANELIRNMSEEKNMSSDNFKLSNSNNGISLTGINGLSSLLSYDVNTMSNTNSSNSVGDLNTYNHLATAKLNTTMTPSVFDEQIEMNCKYNLMNNRKTPFGNIFNFDSNCDDEEYFFSNTIGKIELENYL